MIKISWVVLLVLFMVGSPASALSAETIKIGAIYALTGTAADDNRTSLAGVRLAVEELNQGGGVVGKKIDLMVFDNRSMPIGAKVAVEKAVAAGVVALVGPSWSDHALTAARVAQDRRVPMVSCFATNPEITRVGDFIFRACYTDTFQGRVMATFARRELGATTSVILRKIVDTYSIGLASEFAANFTRLGGRILAETDYRTTQEHLEPTLDLIRRTKPDVVFIPGHSEAGLLAKIIQETLPATICLGGDGWGTHFFFDLGGSELKRAFFCTAWVPESDIPASKDFMARYQGRKIFEATTAQGYDAMMLLGQAIGRAASLEPSAIRDALAATRDFHGITGDISFALGRDPIKSLVINEIDHGKPKYLKTIAPE